MLKSYDADKLDASVGVDTAIPRDNEDNSAPTPGHSTRGRGGQRTGTLGGSNRLLSSREVAAILAIPERTVRDKWKEWGLQAYRIGKHLRWRERDVYAWIERQSA